MARKQWEAGGVYVDNEAGVFMFVSEVLKDGEAFGLAVWDLDFSGHSFQSSPWRLAKSQVRQYRKVAP